MFKSSIALIEIILNHILTDIRSKNPKNLVYKIGFHAYEKEQCLIVLVEVFDKNNIYVDYFE